MPHASRIGELVGFYFGLFIIAGDKAIEWACRYRGAEHCAGFSFSTFAWAALLIAPFMLGRATAGQVWTTLGSAVASRFGKRAP